MKKDKLINLMNNYLAKHRVDTMEIKADPFQSEELDMVFKYRSLEENGMQKMIDYIDDIEFDYAINDIYDGLLHFYSSIPDYVKDNLNMLTIYRGIDDACEYFTIYEKLGWDKDTFYIKLGEWVHDFWVNSSLDLNPEDIASLVVEALKRDVLDIDKLLSNEYHIPDLESAFALNECIFEGEIRLRSEIDKSGGNEL